LDQQESITEFSENTKEIRAQQTVRDKTEREGKSYNWLNSVVNGKLKNLKVLELNKYLDKNKLSKNGKRTD
jgi:hypothetical protein